MDMMTYAMAKAYSDKKGGYTDWEVIFPETELNLNLDGTPSCLLEPPPFSLSGGQVYKVVLNGIEYVQTCHNDEYGACWMGNGILAGASDDTGEPFYILYNASWDGVGVVQIITTYTTATMSVSGGTVHPIDPKYLVKTIDLDKYGISDVIAGLFESGGGTEFLPNAAHLFADITTDSVLRIETTVLGYRFVIDQCYRTYENGIATAVGFSLLVIHNASLLSVNVVLGYDTADRIAIGVTVT